MSTQAESILKGQMRFDPHKGGEYLSEGLRRGVDFFSNMSDIDRKSVV
jgi:hypothetical protein